jgi:arylsulfatase A-like enzyme
MYGEKDVLPVVRSEGERKNPHPVLGAFQSTTVADAFHRDDVRNKVIPAYMGLIRQCDDQIGRLLAYLKESGRMHDTMIVVASDHGDYLGDHWMGDKDYFHDCAVKVPLIVYDPSPESDVTRGTACDELVEAIDLAATFVETAGGKLPDHIIEGRSLLPFLHGQKPETWRDFAISENDYSVMPMAADLGLAPRECRLFMVADKHWKLIHSEGPGHSPVLFDMLNDPQELNDLGTDPAHAEIIDMMYERLGRWARRMSQRTTRSEDDLENMRGRSRRRGVILGLFDGTEIEPDLTDHLKKRTTRSYLDK